MKNNQGFIDLNDLSSYKPNIQKPISTKYRGNTVFTQGPPSGGGVVLLTALNVLEPFNMNGFKENSSATYHLLAEALEKVIMHAQGMWVIQDSSMFQLMT